MAPEQNPNQTPGSIIAAVAAGTVVVPFLIVYAFLFISRGLFVDVDQPDVTSSRTGEAVVGFAAVVFGILIVLGLGRLLSGRARWLFLLGQVLTAAVALDFLLDDSSGEPEVPAVVLTGAVLAIVLSLVPTSWRWVQTYGGTEPVEAATEAADEANELATEAKDADQSHHNPADADLKG